MKIKPLLIFILYTILFLFYPGDSDLFNTFAYHRNLFVQNTSKLELQTVLFPTEKNRIDPAVTAEATYVADLNSLTPVYSKNSNVQMFPASTTKMITALVAYDLYKPTQVITIHHPLEDGQIMGLQEGEKITVEHLLYGALIHSGNDAAYALAQPIGLPAFVEKMNQKAKELHMIHSHFTNPAGLNDPNHYSTAYDLALAGHALLGNPYLANIVSIKEIEISDVDFRIFHKLVNVNKLLGEIPGIGGLKTGYTIEAGENLISLYKRNDGNEMLIVVLKSQDRFEDTRVLVNWIESNVEYRSLN